MPRSPIQTPPPGSRRLVLLRVASVAFLVAACVVVGALAGWRLAGRSTEETEIGRVAFTIHPSLGGHTSAFVPLADWGLRADAIDGLFEIRAELRTLDRSAIGRAADGDISVISETEDQIADGARGALVHATVWALASTAVLLIVLTALWRGLHPRWLVGAVGGGFAVLAHLIAVGAAQWSFDERSLENPTFFARGAELQRIVEVASGQPLTSEYGQTLASVLQSVSLVLDTPPPTSAPGREIFAASDLHANALVIEPLADFIGDEPLLLAGDFGQRGGELESRALAPQVAALGDRVIAVSGNHDTSRLMGALDARGVEVLGDAGEGLELTTVDGLRVAGFPDPLEWQGGGDPDDRPVTFAELDDPEAGFEAAASELIGAYEATAPAPDIVVVHQNGLAQALAQELYERGETHPLTIVTGHDHRQHIDRWGEIVVVDAGTVGAGGVFDTGEADAGFARLQFGSAEPSLRAVDLIAIEPVSGAARAAHVPVPTLCGGDEDVCGFEPPTASVEPPTK